MIDENLEKEIFKDECDRLSELEIAQEYTSWGRWFISDNMLSTWVVLPPKINYLPVQKLYIYDISIERLRNKLGQQKFYEQMQDKNWVGKQGLKDVKRAFKYIGKNKGEIENGNQI